MCQVTTPSKRYSTPYVGLIPIEVNVLTTNEKTLEMGGRVNLGSDIST